MDPTFCTYDDTLVDRHYLTAQLEDAWFQHPAGLISAALLMPITYFHRA
jgi:hypothetical protein